MNPLPFKKMEYDIKTHRKYFLLWAACRACQQPGVGAGNKEQLIPALEKSGVIEFMDNRSNYNIDEESYFTLHDNWVRSICDYMKKMHITISYGKAAKLIAVFVKSYFILDGKEDTELARVAHPPIDSFILEKIDKTHKTDLAKRYKWSKLTKGDYNKLLKDLKEINGPEPFWKIERYWNPLKK